MSDNLETVEQERERMKSERSRLRKKQAMKRKRARVKLLLELIFVLIIALIVLLIVNLTGVFEKRSDIDLLTVRSDGSVIYEEVGDTGDYDKGELKSYISDQIDSFNKESGKGAVKLERFAWGKGKVYVRTRYKNTEVYQSFTGYTFFSGSSTDVAMEGMDCVSGVVRVKKGKKTAEAIDSGDLDGATVLIVGENTSVRVPGTIIGVSDVATELSAKDTVSISSVNEDEDVILNTVIIYKK